MCLLAFGHKVNVYGEDTILYAGYILVCCTDKYYILCFITKNVLWQCTGFELLSVPQDTLPSLTRNRCIELGKAPGHLKN